MIELWHDKCENWRLIVVFHQAKVKLEAAEGSEPGIENTKTNHSMMAAKKASGLLEEHRQVLLRSLQSIPYNLLETSFSNQQFLKGPVPVFQKELYE